MSATIRLFNAPDRVAGTAAGRVIAVASGKGGVGKTWFSITLARALVQLRRQVLLFDGDLGLANVDIQLGLLPKHDLSALVASQRTLADCATPYQPGGSAACWRPRRQAGWPWRRAASALAPPTDSRR